MEPLSLDLHWEGLCAIGLDADLWQWTLSKIETRDDLRKYLETALEEQSRGVSLPFTTIDRATGRIAGCTRFGSIDRPNRRVEIGRTWVGRPFQRSHVNTEAKYLMLTHAFETWGCKRVELKTHEKNERSRSAMLRIGCTYEGLLRNYQTGDVGTRNTAMFSIIDSEWPAVKARLEQMMRREPTRDAAPASQPS
jgi:RimJ/RimL family protein N-acetyltransferase